MRALLLALLVLPVPACDSPSGTHSPDEPSPELQAQRQRQEKERTRERTEYLKRLEDAKRNFAADSDADTFRYYSNAVIYFNSVSAAVRAEIDVVPHEELLLNGAGKQLLDRLLTDYAKKKQRTPELRDALKSVYDSRIQLAFRRRPDSDFTPDGIAALAVGPPEDGWNIADGVWDTDLSFLEVLEQRSGRKAVHQVCRAAFDQVVADDRRDKTRQHYVFAACVIDYGDWETDLAVWADAKETKEFRKFYAPIYAEGAANVDAIEAERAAKNRSKGPGSDKPLVTLINDCDKRIWLVIGDDPKSPGSRKITLTVDETTQERIKADQRVWLVDDTQKVIAHATVSRYTSELEFTCSSVIYR